jgi:hypothetical protein
MPAAAARLRSIRRRGSCQAQQRVVRMILPEEADTPEPTIQCDTPQLGMW